MSNVGAVLFCRYARCKVEQTGEKNKVILLRKKIKLILRNRLQWKENIIVVFTFPNGNVRAYGGCLDSHRR